jgi:hypothetical protein
VLSGREVGDRVVAVRVGLGGGLVRVVLVIAVGVRVDREAADTRFGLPPATGVEVLEVSSARRARAVAAEVREGRGAR